MVPAYVRSLAKTIHTLDHRGLTWNFMTEYSSLVAHAREKTLGGTGFQDPNNRRPGHGTFTYDKVFWIDSDIEWESEDFMRLLQSDKDIISGCYLIETGEVTVFMKPLGMPMTKAEIMERKRPFQARAAGFGFLCIKQGIFEQMDRPWFSQVEVEVINEQTGEKEYKFPLMGEDVSWCEKAYRMGKELWVDPLVRVNHQKTVRLNWNE